VIRWAYKRDRRPVALNFAYLAAIFKKLGHTVEYAEDTVPTGAEIYVFNPRSLRCIWKSRRFAKSSTRIRGPRS